MTRDELIDVVAAALWKAHDTTDALFDDADERRASWANAQNDAEFVVEALLERGVIVRESGLHEH